MSRALELRHGVPRHGTHPHHCRQHPSQPHIVHGAALEAAVLITREPKLLWGTRLSPFPAWHLTSRPVPRGQTPPASPHNTVPPSPYLASTALSTVRGVKIFSRCVSWLGCTKPTMGWSFSNTSCGPQGPGTPPPCLCPHFALTVTLKVMAFCRPSGDTCSSSATVRISVALTTVATSWQSVCGTRRGGGMR